MKKPAKRNPHAIIVLGMHRSGTSALMRLVNLRGVDLGSNLMSPALKNNEYGFWEHMDIYQMNEKLLEDLNSSWDDVRSLPEGWWESETAQRYKLEIINILERDFAKSSFWGVKDPRICRFLPVWRPLLEQIGCKPYFLTIVRNPLEVVSSLAKRDGFSQGKSCLLWLKHIIESEKGTRNTPRLFVTYEEMLSDWKGLMSRVQKSFQFKWPVTLKDASPEIASFLQKSLRHNIVNDTVLIEDNTLSRWIKDLYFETKGAVNGDDSQLIKAVTAIEAELKDSAILYEPVVADIWARYQANHAMLQERNQQLDDIRIRLKGSSQDKGYHLSTIDNLQTENKEKNGRIHQLNTEMVELRDQLSRVQQTVGRHETEAIHLQTGIKDRDERIQQLDNEVVELRDQLSKVQQTVVGRDTEVTHLQTGIKDRDVRIQQLDIEVIELRDRLSEVQQTVVRHKTEATHLQTGIKDRDGRIHELDNELLDLREAFSALQGAVANRKTEITHLQAALEVRDDHIKQLNTESADLRKELIASQEVVGKYGLTVDQLQTEIKERDEHIQQLNAELSGLREEIATSQEALSARETEDKNLHIEIVDKDKRINELDADPGRLQDEVDSMRSQVQNYKLDLEAIFGSKSWKLTSPLRRVSVNFGKVKHKIKIARYLLNRQYRLINKSGLFDAAYYLHQYPDIAESGMNPLLHYLWFGFGEGRDPNPLFDTSYYLEQNPDIAESGINPLAHYYLFGAYEGRNPHPRFNSSQYLQENPDVAESGINPLEHFIKYGIKEGRSLHLQDLLGMPAGNRPQRLRGEFTDIKFEPLVEPPRVPVTISNGKYSSGLLIVSHDASRSGASIIALSITKEISKCYNLDIVVLFLSGGELEAEFKEFADVYNLPDLTKINGSRHKALKAVFMDLKKRNIHTALCNTVVSGNIIQYLKQNGFEIISLIHELTTSINLYGWVSQADSISRHSDKIIFPAEAVFICFKKQFPYKPERFIIKPQGLQIKNPYLREKERMREWLRDQYNISKDASIVLGCGYGDLRKGLDVFANVANAVLSSEKMAHHHFMWVGNPDNTYLAGWLIHDMEKRGFRNNFHLAGHQSDPFKFFAGADIYILTSREDPFPTVFMEAMDAGLPVIAFEGNGGAVEALSDGSGILVPYLSAEAMAEEVIRLLSNKNEMQRIAIRGAFKVHKDYRNPDYVDFILQNFNSVKTVKTLRKRNANTAGASQNPLNILILLGDFDVGGGQMFAIRLANSLTDRCNVFCANAKPELIKPEMVGLLNERVKILDHSGDPVLLAGLIAENDIDVINSHIWWADKLAFQVVRDLDVKWYITMHGCYEHLIQHEATDPMFPKIVKDVLERADGIAYPADKNLQIFDTYPISDALKLVKIYYGLKLTEVKKVQPAEADFGKNTFVAGIVSRAIPSKGWGVAIDTVLNVNRTKKADDKTVHLVLVGDSSYAKELREKYKNEDTIHFAGYVNKPSSWIVRLDVGLLPTYFESESLPNTVIEYLACGKPVVATAIGDIPNMITEGPIKAGTLISLTDHGRPDEEQLAKAIRSYMRDSALLHDHAKNADVLFQQFSMKTCRNKYLRLFAPARSTYGISVVIPLYNHARYIKQTVQSVLEQSVPVDEMIIIDDGSTDRSAEIAKALAEEHYNIRFWSRSNKGAHATINEGIKAASGNYVAVLNSDDKYHPERFAECLSEMNKEPYPEVVFTRVNFLNDLNKIHTLPWYDDGVEYYYAAKNLALALLRCNFFMTTSNIFTKKEVFDKVGLFSNLRYAHDLDFFLRLLLNGVRISFLDKPLLHYRWHESNTISENQEALRVEVAANLAFFAERVWRRSNKDENSFEYIRKISEIASHHKAFQAYNRLLKKATSNDKLENVGQLLEDCEFKESLVTEIRELDHEMRNLIKNDVNTDKSLDRLVSKHFCLEISDCREKWHLPVKHTQDMKEATIANDKHKRLHISATEAEQLKQMPVIFSNPDWDVSGANTFTEILMQNMIAKGYNAKLIITSYYKDQKKVELPNVPLEFLPLSNNTFRQRWSALQDYLIKHSPCIYVPNYDFDMSAISPSLPSGVGIVGIVHSDDEMHYDHVYRLGRYWNATVCVSKLLKEKVAEMNPKFTDRLYMIHCGIRVPDLKCNREYNSENLRIIYTGRIEDRQKRVSDIPGIIRCLDTLDVSYVFTIAGDGEALPKLKQELSSYMKNGLVRILGRISPEEVHRELVEHHVFLLCSGFEGLPISLLEALAHGLVPVVSDIQSGIPEIVHDWENGFIAQIGDVEGFAEHLKELYENRELLKAMSSSSREVFRSGGFDNETMTENYIRLFRKVGLELLRGEYERPKAFCWEAEMGRICVPPWRQVHPDSAN